MSIESIDNSQIKSEDTLAVSSLAEIKARLQERKQRDVSTLPTHFHEALGTVHIGFLSSDGYHDVEVAELRDETVSKWPQEEQLRFVENRRARAYLKHGVVTGDGKKLDSEIIELLLQGDWGAENKKLINAIRKANPPRESLTEQFRVLLGFNQMTVVLLRILAEAGVLEKARDYMLAEEGSEESKALAADLQKWQDTLEVWEAYFEAKDTARHFGLGVYEREIEVEAVNSA